MLADRWARARGGRVTALIVDHGLRPAAADEARRTFDRLGARGIAVRVLTLHGLDGGPRLAERARAARYDALETACAEAGILHLLLGHHAGDQAETVVMRMQAGSHAFGLAGMAALRETARVRLLRPLLATPPSDLRALLTEAGLDWEEDPSNADPAAQRARLRALRGDPDGAGPATAALVEAAAARGRARADGERRIAAELAAHVRFDPAGFATVAAPALSPLALATVLAVVAGATRPPPTRAVAALAARLAPATLGGARILAGGRTAPGAWLIAREAVAMAPAVPARAGTVWDQRFRIRRDRPGLTVGALGDAATGLRKFSALPHAVLCTFPALRDGAVVREVPHLSRDRDPCTISIVASPPRPAACAPFAPSIGECYVRGC